jgi:nitroreductase
VELREAVRARRMVRSYDPGRPVDPGLLSELLELAIRAPSAGFSQGWDFLVLREPADRQRYWAATADDEPDRWLRGMMSAPVLVLCLSDREHYLERYAEPDKGWTDRDPARWPVPYWDVDTGMAAMILLLAAVDAGLASCFFGTPPHHQERVLADFGVPADRRVVGVVSLGYPGPEAGRKSPSLRRGRRPLSDVGHDGHFTTPWPTPPSP